MIKGTQQEGRYVGDENNSRFKRVFVADSSADYIHMGDAVLMTLSEYEALTSDQPTQSEVSKHKDTVAILMGLVEKEKGIIAMLEEGSKFPGVQDALRVLEDDELEDADE